MAGCPQVSDDSASSGISSGAETELYTEESDEEGGVLLVPKMITTSHHSNDVMEEVGRSITVHTII